MKTLSKIHLRTVSETLSENEMKAITGGIGGYDDASPYWCNRSNPKCKKQSDCSSNKLCYTCNENNQKYCA